MSRLLSQKMRPLSTHPILCVYAKCGDILHTTSFNTLMGLSCYCDALGYDLDIEMCQCPHGLIPHFYVNKAFKLRIYKKLCQCPLGLIPHFYEETNIPTKAKESSVNALSGLYLISTVPLQKPRFYAVSRACFCRYLSEYSDSSRFSCMLTFWTYLMRCTYP